MSRSTNHRTVDASLSLRVYDLFRAAGIRPGQDGAGVKRWCWRPNGEHAGSLCFRIATSNPNMPHVPHVQLFYTLDGERVEDWIALERTSCRFGGWRWWFTCPASGRRVGALHLPPGGRQFAGRLAWRLAYQSSRNTRLDCAHDRLRRLYAKLGAKYPYELPSRPKGMHHATFARYEWALEDADARLMDVPFGRRIMRLIEKGR